MTCIAAIAINGKVWMGADSAGTTGALDSFVMMNEKIFKKDNYLIGCSGDAKFSNVLKYEFDPSPCPDWDLEKHMCSTFINQLSTCMNKHSYHNKDSTILIGTQGRIFQIICDNYFVMWLKNNYNAIGIGASFALGSIYTTIKTIPASPEIVLHHALNAAQQFNAGVKEPFIIKSI